MKRMMEWLLAVAAGICLALAAQVMGLVNPVPVYVWPTTLTLTNGDGMKIAESRFFVLDVGDFEHPIDGEYTTYKAPSSVVYRHQFGPRRRWR